MLDSAKSIHDFFESHSMENYEENRMLRRAIEREIEIIGEASRKISRDFQIAHPEIPWKAIISLRNILAHDYGNLVNEKIFSVCKKRIPKFIGILPKFLPDGFK